MAAYHRFVTHVTCRLTAKNWDQLRNPTLGNRVSATFTFFPVLQVFNLSVSVYVGIYVPACAWLEALSDRLAVNFSFFAVVCCFPKLHIYAVSCSDVHFPHVIVCCYLSVLCRHRAVKRACACVCICAVLDSPSLLLCVKFRVVC